MFIVVSLNTIVSISMLHTLNTDIDAGVYR